MREPFRPRPDVSNFDEMRIAAGRHLGEEMYPDSMACDERAIFDAIGSIQWLVDRETNPERMHVLRERIGVLWGAMDALATRAGHHLNELNRRG